MQKLPKSWQEILKSVPLEDFHYVLSFSSNNPHQVYPLSLICLKALIKILVLPRQIDSHNNISFIQTVQNSKNCTLNLYNKSFNNLKLWNTFLKHVKQKKRYEIFKMAEITYDIASKLNVKLIVDVGSGLGHLSRILAYGFQFTVSAIESNHELIQQARCLDFEFEMSAQKLLNDQELIEIKRNSPIHINKTIQFGVSSSCFLQDLKDAFSIKDDNFKFGIIGLHPCGDLAAYLLNLYTNCPQAQFINIAGCCYHKLSATKSQNINPAYPLSNFCMKNFTPLSYEAKALACHAIEAYCQRLKSKDCAHLKVHCFRAALEKIINDKWPQYKKTGLSNVKSNPNLNFKMYCETALRKLDVKLSEQDLNSEETLQNLRKWQDVVKYYSFRLMLAPLIETVILLDRKLYLLEKGISCKIVSAFDPQISPRNQLLISDKSL